MTTLVNKLHGEYRLVVDRGGKTIQDTGWFSNLILNSGLDFLGTFDSGGSVFEATNYCKVGTGTGAPLPTQTALEAQVASVAYFSAPTKVNSGSPDYISEQTTYYQFPIGAVVGNIGEIGVGWLTGVGNLFSRARILDGSGNPTTISLTSIDQLRAYYRVHVVPDTTDFNGSLTIGSTVYNYTGRRAAIGGFDPNLYGGFVLYGRISSCSAYGSDFALGPITGNPTGTSAGSGVASYGTYNSGAYYLDSTFTWDTGSANIGGLKGFYLDLGGSSYFQIELDAVVPKDDTKTFSMTFRNSWMRL